jgi:serine/threonine-protein kinase
MPDSTAATEPSPAPVPAPGDERIGTRVGKYEIARVIGRGGMGMVFEAVHGAIGKRVAVKLIDASMAQNRDAVARFQREAQAASAVESAHIVQIFDAGATDDGVPFIVMELLRGEDLGHRIRRLGRLELDEALHVVAQILRGLHRAHQAGIVHRDLKPDNVFLVDRDDDPTFAKILDFGISKVARTSDAAPHTLTRQGTVLGTPFYMSPEQAQAMPDVDGRTDLWAVGAILYECLTGRPPHTGGAYEQVIVNICMKDADDIRAHNPAVPEPIAKVVARALARDRDARFATARELLDALVASSGDVLSSRTARTSLDDQGPARASATSTPSGSTPARATPVAVRSGDGASGLDATLEAAAELPSRVGWSTGARGGAPARRVGVGAVIVLGLLGGGWLAFGGRTPPAPAATPPATTSVEVDLVSRIPGARFWVDGVPVSDGHLRGVKGERKKVRVEAPGYVALESEILLDPSEQAVSLDPARMDVPTVTPGTTATASAPAPSASAKPGHAPSGKPRVPATPTTSTATATPKTADPPPPSTGGVAPALRIKTE